MACYSCSLVEVLAITCAMTWDTQQVPRIFPEFTPWYLVASNGDLGPQVPSKITGQSNVVDDGLGAKHLALEVPAACSPI